MFHANPVDPLRNILFGSFVWFRLGSEAVENNPPLFRRERGESVFLPFSQVFFGKCHYPDYPFLNLFK
jgi:hypothetical protein